jgi:hypothetical protein
MAYLCHAGVTKEEFTYLPDLGIVFLSSSGGGLFRRPTTYLVRGASLFSGVSIFVNWGSQVNIALTAYIAVRYA